MKKIMKKINSKKPQSDINCDKWMTERNTQKTSKNIIFYNNSFPISLHKALLKINTTLTIKI